MLGGLKRILKSSKGIAALTSITGVVLIYVLGVEPDMALKLSISIVTMAGLYIVTTAAEDMAAKKNGGGGEA